MSRLNNERGFMFLNVVFLTLITSFAAMVLFNAIPRIKNPQSVLRLTAIHLANKQFALMESKAFEPGILDLNCLLDDEDLTTENFSEKSPITFTVTPHENSSDGNLHEVTVKVEWEIDGQSSSLEVERTIRVVQ